MSDRLKHILSRDGIRVLKDKIILITDYHDSYIIQKSLSVATTNTIVPRVL